MIIREKIYVYIEDHPGRSAFEIAVGIDELVQSVASLLAKEAKEGRLVRKRDAEHHGPKGGNVYYLPTQETNG